MHRTASVCSGILAALVLFPAAGAADVLVMAADGRRERGVIVQEGPQGYWLKTGPRMQVLYTHAEVREVVRESDEVNDRLRAGWTAAPVGARTSAAGAGTVHAAALDPTARRLGTPGEGPEELKAGEKVKEEDRYAYITAGGFVLGQSTKSDVRDKMGSPDQTTTSKDDVEIWHFMINDHDAYAMMFQLNEETGREVLSRMWVVSNLKQQIERRKAREAFKREHGH